jgi:dTDP-4-amino-4,6-dideoxygalactose transaminase
MISRTKVNYNFSDLCTTFFMNESRNDSRVHFIDKLSDYYQEKNILLTPSGRCGLYLLLKALDHKRVIIPAYTCKAVAEAAIT